MNKLLIATNNKGKVEELQDLLKDTGLELVIPADINLSLEVDEDGNTYAENATKKAVAFALASGLISLADDWASKWMHSTGPRLIFCTLLSEPGAKDKTATRSSCST